MNCYLLVNSGLEEVAEQEVKELVKTVTKKQNRVIDFEVNNKKEMEKLTPLIQSGRRLLLSLGKTKTINNFEFKEVVWSEFLPLTFTFKVEVEGVKGNETRREMAQIIADKFYRAIEKEGIPPEIKLKTPELLLVVYFNGEEYFLGIDFKVEELNLRPYRVFPHSASFKGDLAYYFVRKSGFKPGKKLLVGFCKDGTLALEAAGWAKESKVFAFDETTQNIIAARKNAKLAKVTNLEINKFPLDELDVKFSEQEFDYLIFQVTTKDEHKLNEMYYQAGYVLKKKGRLMLIGRKHWGVTLSTKFDLKEEKEIKKGETVYHYWILEKK